MVTPPPRLAPPSVRHGHAADMRRMARILREHKLVLGKQRADVQRSLNATRSELHRLKRDINDCRLRLIDIEAELQQEEQDQQQYRLTWTSRSLSLEEDADKDDQSDDDLLLDRDEELRLLVDLQRAYDLEWRAMQSLIRWQRHLQQESERLQRIERALAARALRMGVVRLPTEMETSPEPVGDPTVIKKSQLHKTV